jgi:long-chain acyl-CoA synthetase
MDGNETPAHDGRVSDVEPDTFLRRLLRCDDPPAATRPALSGRGVTGFTYAELAGAVRRAGGVLADLGVRPGDRVAVVAPNGPTWVATFLGILASGAVAVPLDDNLPVPGLATLLRDADPAVVLATPATAETVRAAADRAGLRGVVSTSMSCAISRSAWRTVPRRPDDPALIAYTSGATGAPKGVVLTWANLTYQVITIAARQRIPDGASFVSILPAYHMFELIAGCLTPLYLGASVHYPGSLLLADILAAVVTHRATDLVVVPLFLVALRRRLRAEAGPVGSALRTVRRFFVGGAPLEPELAGYFQRLGWQVCQGYGLTEAAPIVAANSPARNRPGSVGRPLPGTEVRIGADGEISVRGPGLMRGYWRRPELTAATLDADGWLHTGDTGFVDRAGYLFVTGRTTDLIVLANGENVHPAEVESVLDRSHLVDEVWVTGRPGPDGEEIVAVVTASEAARAIPVAEREQALVAEVRRLSAALAHWKRPRRIVVHDGGLPRTPTRKVRRPDVEELLNAHE